MKRVVVIIAIAVLAVLTGALTGCDFLSPATPLEQVEGFLLAASAEPQNNATLQSYFDPAAADYPNMDLDTYWELRFFNVTDGSYGILGAVDGSEDPEFSGSVTVTGNVTSANNLDPGYPAIFVLTTDPNAMFADPLIRKITVTVVDVDEIIEKVIP